MKTPPPYVSRGGEKLAHALARTGARVEGRRCLDVGASTGGFTDCLLQHGAAFVVAPGSPRSAHHARTPAPVTSKQATSASARSRSRSPAALSRMALPTRSNTGVASDPSSRLTALYKADGVWCQHFRKGGGCGQYDLRPAACRGFHCLWLTSTRLGDEWRPDKAGFVNAVADFYLTNPIARASKTMAECSALKNVRNLEAAE